MQIWAEPEKAALPICNYSQILYQFLTFTQNLKRSQTRGLARFLTFQVLCYIMVLLAMSVPSRTALRRIGYALFLDVTIVFTN